MQNTPEIEASVKQRWQTVLRIRDGVFRWLDRPENIWWKNAFTQNTRMQLWDLCIPEALFEEMNAGEWLRPERSGHPSAIDLFYDDVMWEVCAALCLP